MSGWLFDLGNTRLKCAPLGADGLRGDVVALAHDDDATAADLGAALARLLPSRFAVAYVSSVASDRLRLALLDALLSRCSRVCIASTQSTLLGLRIAYAQPRRLGVDRFLALLGATARDGAALVCGVGTAMTIDLVDAAGLHRGGRIAPSPALMRAALHQRAAQLPLTGGKYHASGGDAQPFVADTADALASGCDGAAVALIQQSIAAAHDELGAAPQLLLHGGGSEPLLAHFPAAIHVPALVLDGLSQWARAATAPGRGATG